MAPPVARKKVTMWLPVTFHRLLREEAVQRGVDIGTIVEEAVHARVTLVHTRRADAPAQLEDVVVPEAKP